MLKKDEKKKDLTGVRSKQLDVKMTSTISDDGIKTFERII